MKQKKDKFKDYIKTYLINHNEEFKYLLNLKGIKRDPKSYKYMTNKIYSLRFILKPGYVDQILCDQFVEAYKNEDFETCLEALVYVYKYYYFEIYMSYSDFPNKLYRKFLIPFRNTIGDLINTMIVLIRASGNHPSNITAGGVEYITEAEKVDSLLEFKDSVDFASNHSAYELLDKKIGRFYYDYADGYEFNLTFGKSIIIDDNLCNLNMILSECYGYGIFEDNRLVLNEFLRDPKAYNNYERKLVKDMIPFDFFEPKTDELIFKFENYYKNISELFSYIENKEDEN